MKPLMTRSNDNILPDILTQKVSWKKFCVILKSNFLCNSRRMLKNRKTFFTSVANICLHVERQSSVKRLILNSPKTLNALSSHMMHELLKEITSTSTDEHRCIVIDSSSKVFCAGHDLKELNLAAADNKPTVTASDLFSLCTELMLSLRKAPVPVIGLIDGPAVAAGCQLAASCDFLFATKRASFGLPGIKIGLFCTTPAVPVVRVLPPKLTFEMLCTGDSISADVACRHGLVTKVAEDREGMEKMCDEVVQKICSHSAEVIALGKQEFYSQMSKLTEMEAYSSAQCVMTENAYHRHCQKGIEAFFMKQKPVFD